jgi:CRP/FNR family transcriptional regulator, cyclic AMP receptor protein
METLERIIAEQPFVEGLESYYVQLLVGCAKNIVFDAGQTIFREGEEAHEFYLLRHGKVAVEIHAPQRAPIVVETLADGDVLGWSWLIPPHYWRFTARAVTQVRAIALDGKCLRTKCEANHDLGYELLKRFADIMSRRMDAARYQVIDVYGSGVIK